MASRNVDCKIRRHYNAYIIPIIDVTTARSDAKIMLVVATGGTTKSRLRRPGAGSDHGGLNS